MYHVFRLCKYCALWDYGQKVIWEQDWLIDELMAIPADASTATIQGVEMQTISSEQADRILEDDTDAVILGECIMNNGRFLFESENGKLKTLYKVGI